MVRFAALISVLSSCRGELTTPSPTAPDAPISTTLDARTPDVSPDAWCVTVSAGDCHPGHIHVQGAAGDCLASGCHGPGANDHYAAQPGPPPPYQFTFAGTVVGKRAQSAYVGFGSLMERTYCDGTFYFYGVEDVQIALISDCPTTLSAQTARSGHCNQCHSGSPTGQLILTLD